MKLLLCSWNVNGLRACLKKGFEQWLDSEHKDIICLQETKSHPEQLPEKFVDHPDYYCFYASAEKKGYSGVALFSSKKIDKPIITIGTGEKKFDNEGRTIIAEYKKFILFSCYFPNGQRDHNRVPYKLSYSKKIQKLAHELETKKKKPVIITGDVNTAHQEIDLANPKTNTKTTGFLPNERKWVSDFLDSGFVDAFREYTPDENGHYTWWTYRGDCRARNVGWRIDYFLCSKKAMKKVNNCYHRPEVMGSDHCPIYLEAEL